MPTIRASVQLSQLCAGGLQQSGQSGEKFIAGRVGELPSSHGPCHDVEVVQIESMCCADRVVSTRHQDHVAILYGHGFVQCPIVCVDTLEGEAAGAREAVIVRL